MLSEEKQEYLEGFEELRSIGQDLADKINAWNENNLDEDKNIGVITLDMSGDAVATAYTENGYEEEDVVRMLNAVGFVLPDESDDTVEADLKITNDVDERLNSFIRQCVEVANSYPYFVSGIELQPGNAQRKEEVRIVIPSDADFRKLPFTNARKIMFMHFLKDIREKAAQHSMLDEALCYCATRQEFLIVLKPLCRHAPR